MSFGVNMPHYTNIGSLTAEIWRLTDFQNDGRDCSILILVSYLLMSLTSEGKCLSANQILSTYLNSWPIYNYFRFGKNESPLYWNSTSGFDFGYITTIGMPFCIRLPHFKQIGPLTAEIWRYFDSTWRTRSLNTTSGFYLLTQLYSEGQNLSANQISSTYINSWLTYNYFRFGKTNVRHIRILLRVSTLTISP